jgi:hypothetical protein
MSTFAENLPYWKTSRISADGWLQKAAREIDRAGGVILSEGFGSSGGRSAFLIRFEVGDRTFRVVWPCSESKYTGHDLRAEFKNAARRQAATMLYHDVKAMCVKARVVGFEVAFFSHMEMPDGRVASELVGAVGDLPKLLGSG